MNHSRRKRHFIDAKVQGALVLRMVQHWVLFMFGTMAFLGCLEMLVSGYEAPVSEHFWRVWERHRAFLIAALVIQPAFFWDIIKLSHRFVGPVARVRTGLQAIAEGKPASPIALREKDFWADLATDFNAALQRIDRDRTTCDRLTKSGCPSSYDESHSAEAELQTCP